MRASVGVLVATAFAITSCSGGSTVPTTTDPEFTAACQALALRSVEPMAEFIDVYEGYSVAQWNALEPPPDIEAVQSAVRTRAQLAVKRGCPVGALEQAILDAIEELQGDGAVGEAIAAALKGEEPVAGAASTKPRQQSPSTRTVRPSDDLADVLATVGTGSTVELAAGTYRVDEAILIDVSVTIVGAGRDATKIESRAAGVAMVFLGPGRLDLRDLTLAHVGAADASVLLAVQGALAVSGARITGGVAATGDGGGGHGIVLAFEQLPGFPERGDVDPTAPVTITDSLINGNAAAGVLSSGDAAPVLERLEVSDNGSCGVCWAGKAAGRLADSTVTRNRIGIQVGDTAAPTIERVAIAANVDVGVSADGTSTPTVLAGTITDNGQIGVQATADAAPVLDGVTISGHGVGVLLTGAARARLTSSTLSGHEIGLRAGGTSQPECTGTTIESSAIAAVSITEQAAGTISGNRITGAAALGIQVTGSATPVVSDNTINGAGQAGIQVGETATPTISANTVRDSGSIGILVGDQAGGTVRSNTISGAALAAVMVGGSASPSVRDNTISDNDVGIVYRDSARGTASGNRLTRHVVAVQVIGSASPTIEGNSISSSTEAGVAYGGSAGGRFSGNTLTANGNISIQVAESARPTISGNELRGRAVYGILLRDSARGTVSGNRIIDHIFGIQVVDRAAPSLVRNAFTDIALTSIVYADSAGGEAVGNTCQESGLSSGISVTAPANPVLSGNQCSITRSA